MCACCGGALHPIGESVSEMLDATEGFGICRDR
ncbi:IS66 family transposase zinc-finger binding domain-containing protein [Mesorhizobium sp. M7A.F.Ca.MR.245.00.0.0]|nr:IS66 family transposase zinc-finger binding domain-containing protein [Mesorhizobium sp. M7A.F.Ca.MR.245.00.0.0]